MIFESPDGGKTVTVRAPHSLEKQHLSFDPHDLGQWFDWRKILEESKTNIPLKDALDHARIIYELSRRDQD
jgi:hypothetical protein